MAHTETTTAPLKYSREKDAFGVVQYVAETETHRFVVRRNRAHRREWMAEIWTLKSVGFVDPIKVADEKVCDLEYNFSRAQAYAVVQQYREGYKI